MTDKENELLPCRDAFEEWYTDKPGCPSIAKADGKYVLMQAHAAWLAWQAAWECAQPQNVEVVDIKNKTMNYINSILMNELTIHQWEALDLAFKYLSEKGYLSYPQQEPSGDVQAALDALFHYYGYTSHNASIENQKEVWNALQTIRAAITAQQPDVNQELLEACNTVLDWLNEPILHSKDVGGMDRAKAVLYRAIARAEQKGGV